VLPQPAVSSRLKLLETGPRECRRFVDAEVLRPALKGSDDLADDDRLSGNRQEATQPIPGTGAAESEPHHREDQAYY
jgi:hypothetical protein